MSLREKEHLTELWLAECAATIKLREWKPLDDDLPQLKMPLFCALMALERRGLVLDDVRPKLEKMVAAVGGLGLRPADTHGALSAVNGMLDAVTEDDESRFRWRVSELRKELASPYKFGGRAKKNAPTIEDGISSLSELTGWPSKNAWEV